MAERRILTEEQKNAHDMIALRKWVQDYELKNGKEPTRGEIFGFILILKERNVIDETIDLVELQEEEVEIRELAKDICKVQNINPDHIRIILAPSPNFSFRVQGGTPSELILGIRKKAPGFKIILAEAIRRAGRLYRKSALVPMSKVLEYKHETKKYTKKPDGDEWYPLIASERVKINVFEVLEIVDTKTGESVRVERHMDSGMFKHYLNDRLAHEGRLVLTRNMLAKGMLKEDEVSDSEDNNDNQINGDTENGNDA